MLHLHGEIRKARSTQDFSRLMQLGEGDIRLGDRCELGSQLRPHLVWFGESVPAMPEAGELVRQADVLLVVNLEIPEAVAGAGFEAVAKPATDGVPQVVAELLAAAAR